MAGTITIPGDMAVDKPFSRQWYVLKTKPHAELQVAHVLEARQLEIYLPLLRGRRALDPLFPGYLFLRIDCQTDEYLRSRSAPGVSYILCTEGVPVPVMEGLIEEIGRRLDKENKLGPADRFAYGERVVVTAGPFRGLEAVFDRSTTPKGRCLILLQILGRLTQVQVDANCLAKAGA